MYIPPPFLENRTAELRALIEHYPLGALVRHGPAGLDADHLPFEFDPQGGGPGRLLAHVARANPLWRNTQDGDEVLVIFRAQDAYVSPNWYPSKQETHRLVPTWNYQVVHVHGRIRIHDDEKFVRGLVARLTRLHEQRAGEAKPWRMTDAPPEHIDALLKSIVGIEVEIASMAGKFKLGQNREPRDRVNAAEELDRRAAPDLAAAMRKAEPWSG